MFDLFLLSIKSLFSFEARHLFADDCALLRLFHNLFFLRVDNNLSHNDLLGDMLLIYLGLLESLACVSQLGSSRSFLSNGSLSLGSESLNLLLVGCDLFLNSIDLSLNLGLL